jgi:uncharacterized MAPEG superfamily protein
VEPYSHAIAALALWALLMLVLSMLSASGRAPEGRCACGQPKQDYADPVYRRDRAFKNAIEASGPFIAVTLAAMLIGASPFVVNLLASVFVVARLAMAVVHIATEIKPLRSVLWMIGFFSVIAQAVVVLLAAF